MSESSAAATELQTRVTELEVKLGFAEDLLDGLNRQVFRQQEQIETLQRQIIALHRQLQSQDGEGRGEPRDELPPHY